MSNDGKIRQLKENISEEGLKKLIVLFEALSHEDKAKFLYAIQDHIADIFGLVNI